jgi:hypothetical protein
MGRSLIEMLGRIKEAEDSRIVIIIRMYAIIFTFIIWIF